MNDDCLKLTTYFGERHRTEEQFVADALLDLYGRKEVEVSVMLRGAEGFGLKHHLRTDRLLTLSEDLPLVSVAVDTRARIENLLEEVIVDQASRADHARAGADADRRDRGRSTLPEELHEATKLTIYVGRQERSTGSPAFVAVCDLLHRRGVAGATVLLGVDGTAHGVRAAGALLRAQRRGADDDHRRRRRRADRAGAARARRAAAAPAAHARARARLQARRRAARATEAASDHR